MAALLLCAATCAAWARSYWAVERVGIVRHTPGIDSEDHHVYLLVNWGVAELTVGGDPPENFSHVRWAWDRYDAHATNYVGGAQPRWLGWLGVGWSRRQTLVTGETTWSAYLRLSTPTAVLAAAAAWLTRRWLAATRARPGRCAACGYDLRASPERCPECGRLAPTAPPPARPTVPAPPRA